jgi:uncharacterized membrane protein YhiD involved in acid resistance
MSIQYRLVQSGKTASGGCSAGQGSSEPVVPRILFIIVRKFVFVLVQSKYDFQQKSLKHVTLKYDTVKMTKQTNKITKRSIKVERVRIKQETKYLYNKKQINKNYTTHTSSKSM